MPVEAGKVVSWRGDRWLVTELLDACGGGKNACLECLERDHFAAVNLDDVRVLEDHGEEDVVRLRATRDLAQAPRRLERKIALVEKMIVRSKERLSVLSGHPDEEKEMRRLERRRKHLDGWKNLRGLPSTELLLHLDAQEPPKETTPEPEFEPVEEGVSDE